MNRDTPIITRARQGQPLSSLNRKKRGTLQEVFDYFNAKDVKGEIVIVVEGKK